MLTLVFQYTILSTNYLFNDILIIIKDKLCAIVEMNIISVILINVSNFDPLINLRSLADQKFEERGG